MCLGKNVCCFCEEKGWSQEEYVDWVDIYCIYVSDIECGCWNLMVILVEKLVKLFGIVLGWLFDDQLLSVMVVLISLVMWLEVCLRLCSCKVCWVLFVYLIVRVLLIIFFMIMLVWVQSFEMRFVVLVFMGVYSYGVVWKFIFSFCEGWLCEGWLVVMVLLMIWNGFF